MPIRTCAEVMLRKARNLAILCSIDNALSFLDHKFSSPTLFVFFSIIPYLVCVIQFLNYFSNLWVWHDSKCYFYCFVFSILFLYFLIVSCPHTLKTNWRRPSPALHAPYRQFIRKFKVKNTKLRSKRTKSNLWSLLRRVFFLRVNNLFLTPV